MKDLITIKRIEMEKQIKMSLETARKLWKDNKVDGYMPLIDFLLENFTKEELEGKKGFTWEDSFDGKGFMLFDGTIESCLDCNITEADKEIFKTEAQAKSALAFAQLSHIVAKYNEGKEPNGTFYNVTAYDGYNLGINNFRAGIDLGLHLPFIAFEDAKLSMEVNRQLWLDYWMIQKTQTFTTWTNK